MKTLIVIPIVLLVLATSSCKKAQIIDEPQITSNSLYFTACPLVPINNPGGSAITPGTYRCTFAGMTLRIHVSAVPTQLFDGESYVANIEYVENIGNGYVISQSENVFTLVMSYPQQIDQPKLYSELNDWTSAFSEFIASQNTSNPKPYPVWTDYMKYDWYTGTQTQSFSGKFVIVENYGSYSLYITDPTYPVAGSLPFLED